MMNSYLFIDFYSPYSTIFLDLINHDSYPIDPDGVVHHTVDYPGIPVDHTTITKKHDVLKDIRIPIRAHFGTIGV
jgi:hypothetical protein